MSRSVAASMDDSYEVIILIELLSDDFGDAWQSKLVLSHSWNYDMLGYGDNW